MINWWLIVLAVLISIVLLGMSVYFVILYQSEEDRTSAWFPKVVVVLGLTLACCTVLLLPLDVANRKDPTAMKRFNSTELDTALMWQIILWMLGIMVVVIIPFTTFYYEAYDPDQGSFAQQITPAFMYTLVLDMCFFGLTVLLWLTVGIADIPFFSYQGFIQARLPLDSALVYYDQKTVETLELPVSFFVYIIAMVTALGWIFFFIYGGVGLTALPVDIIYEYMHRPKRITAAEYAREVNQIAAQAQRLMSVGKELQEKERKKNNNSIRNKINLFKNEVYILERNLDRLEISYKDQGGSPFVIYGKLLVGVIGMFISLMWILHIFIYNTINLNPFLNTVLRQLDAAFSLLGVIFYAIFAFWLLWCTIRGCVKVGMRIIFFTIHPMKVGDTLMNSMLFNVGLVLLSSMAVTQFAASSFRDYASNTAVDTLLNTYVRRLKGIGVVIVYMQYGLVLVAIVSIFWVILCPRKKPKEKDRNKDSDSD